MMDRALATGVTGLVLAGGLGRRMGGVDKGLQMLRGEPMVAHVLRRLAPQVDAVLVNANQNADAYASIASSIMASMRPSTSSSVQPCDVSIVPDIVGGFAGPLAGLHAGLAAATTPMLVTVPCDSPFLPLDLVSRLRGAMQSSDAQIAVAKTGAQAHPVFALVDVDVRDSLGAFLESGGRKIDAWYAALRVVEVAFDDEADAFENINTRDELKAFER